MAGTRPRLGIGHRQSPDATQRSGGEALPRLEEREGSRGGREGGERRGLRIDCAVWEWQRGTRILNRERSQAGGLRHSGCGGIKWRGFHALRRTPNIIHTQDLTV